MWTVTRAWVMEHRTPRGAWTRDQIEQLGLTWPMRHGWIDRVSGREITEEAQQRFECKLTRDEVNPLARFDRYEDWEAQKPCWAVVEYRPSTNPPTPSSRLTRARRKMSPGVLDAIVTVGSQSKKTRRRRKRGPMPQQSMVPRLVRR